MKKGIADLMAKNNLRWSDLRDLIVNSEIPQFSGTYNNVWNLINAKINPKDPSIYILLSQVFDVSLSDIILRYSELDDVRISKTKIPFKLPKKEDSGSW